MKLYQMNQENYAAHLRYIAEHYADRTSVMAAVAMLNPEKDGALIEEMILALDKPFYFY